LSPSDAGGQRAAVCFQIRRMNERMKKDKTLRRRVAQIEKQLQQEKEA
jgi:hypothetical protein